ncbi:MAG: NrdH-redoxin [Candidatus Cloacimonetes bacterium]|nr:NrdH-redoxin [Candidatus Cloacimonadota bacterium]
MEKRVVVFSTPTCAWCTKLKSYLRQHNIRFKDIDVSRNQSAARDMVNKTGQQGVPQMWVNNQPVVGFDKTKINRLLGIGGQ